MTRSILIDEIHLQVYAPRGLPEAESERIVQFLNRPRLLTRLRAAVQGVLRQHPALRTLRVVLSR